MQWVYRSAVLVVLVLILGVVWWRSRPAPPPPPPAGGVVGDVVQRQVDEREAIAEAQRAKNEAANEANVAEMLRGKPATRP